MKTVSIRMPQEIWNQLHDNAKENMRSINNEVLYQLKTIYHTQEENSQWLKKAKDAESEGYLGVQDSTNFLESL